MKFKIEKDKLILLEDENINSKTINYYEINFEFPEEWQELSKKVIFIDKNRQDVFEFAIIDNKCIVPNLEHSVYNIGVVGFKVEDNNIVNRITTNLIPKCFGESSGDYEANREISEEKASVYELYIQRITNLTIEIIEDIATIRDLKLNIEELKDQVIETYNLNLDLKYEIDLKYRRFVFDITNYINAKKEELDNYTNGKKQDIDDYVEEKSNDLESVKEELTSEFNQNSSDKMQSFNENVVEKTNDFDTSIENKMQEEINNAKDELDTYTNSKKTELDNYNTDKSTELDTKKTEIEDSLDDKKEELENDFNTNAETKTNNFNTNYTNKISDFNTNSTNKTTEFNQNAIDKINYYNENAERVLSLEERIDGLLISKQSEKGETIHVYDSAEWEGKLSIEGNDKQETRDGYNLFNMEDTTHFAFRQKTGYYQALTLLEYSSNRIKVRPNHGSYSESYIDITGLKSNTEYNLSYIITENTTGFNPTMNLQNSSITDENGNITIGIGLNNGGTIGLDTTYVVFDKIQLTEGTEVKPYEPYGVMPSAEFPSEIETVGNKGHHLPSEYQEVEYLEFTGTQYIDTGYIPNNNTKIRTRVKLNDLVNNQAIFGSRSSGTYITSLNQFYFNIISNNGDTSKIFLGTKDTKIHSFLNTDNVINLEIDIKNLKFKIIDTNTVIDLQSNFDNNATQSLYLGALNNIGRAYVYSKYDNYSFEIYDNNELVRNYIPCYRKSDNKPGLYDLVNNEFYINQGTGEFSVGQDVKNELNIETSNKNFYNPSKAYRRGTLNQNIGFNLSLEKNENYCFKINKTYATVYLYDSNGRQTRELGGASTNNQISFQTTNEEIEGDFVFYSGITDVDINTYDFSGIQIKKGTEATEYVKHQGETITLPIQEEMLKNDTFVKIGGNWFEKHNWNKKVLNGTEEFEISNDDKKKVYKFRISKANFDNNLYLPNSNEISMISNKMIATSDNNIIQFQKESIWISKSLQYFYISIYKNRMGNTYSINNFKNYLFENNIEIYYQLEEPIYLPCTTEQIQALEKLEHLKTYKNQTIVNSDSIALLQLDYKEDIETRLNNIEAMILAE